MLVSGLASCACLLMACGGGDDKETKEEGGGSSGGSLESITGALESPTGTLDESTAADVAMAFEESMGAPAGGGRDGANPASAQDTSVACTNGGDLTANANSDGTAVSVDYNDCCEATCCLNGSLTTFTDTSGTATYSTCVDYDISASCDGIDGTYSFQYCQGAAGLVYAIEVNGDTFAVSGSMSNGTGSLSITSANGSFTCEYTDYTGTCTSDGGEMFSF